MSQVKCFNFDLMKSVVGAGKFSYKRIKTEQKPDIGSFVFNKIEAFVDNDYPIEERLKMSTDKRRELIDLIVRVSGESDIFYDPEFIENRLFPDVSLVESTNQDEPTGLINVGTIFQAPKSYVSDDQKMYGSQIYPRMLMQNAFKQLSVRSFFIRHGHAVNPNDVSINIFVEKLRLVNDILDNLSDDKIRYIENKKIITVSMLRKQVKQMSDIIFGIGNDNIGLTRTDKINKLSQLPPINMDAIEYLFTSKSELSIADDVLNKWSTGTQSEKAKLRSYNNIFILRNFDALLKKNFSNLVDIKNENSSKNISYVDYSINLDSNNINKSWQNQSDDISAYKEAGNVVRALIETMPFYKMKTKSATDSTIEWNKFNNAIGFLKNIPYTNASSLEVYMKDEFGRIVSIGTIGKLISDMNNDPSNNVKKVFDALFIGTNDNGKTKFINLLMDRFFINKNYQRIAVKDMLYSINQSFYGDKNGLNLYRTMSQNKSNPSIPDYYNFMTQYIAGSYRMQFVYFRRNPRKTDYEVRVYILNDRAMNLTKRRIESRIYNASKGIVNEFISISKSRITPEMKDRFGSKEQQQPSVTYDLVKPIGQNDKIRSRVLFNAIPINGKLYNISFDTTNPYILATDNMTPFTVVERLSNGKTGNPVSIKDVVSEAVKNGNLDTMSTDLDDILSIAYSLPINSDTSLRRVIYDDNGKFNESNIGELLRGALSIIGISEVNNSYFSQIKDSKTLNNEILNSRIFPLVREGQSSIMKMFNRRGINNMSANIGNVMNTILEAVAYTDNVLGRDSIASPDGTQISATQLNRLVLSFDSQSQRIKDAAKKGELAPAKSLMVNSTAGEFFDNLVANGVVDAADTELLKGMDRREQLFKGTYTTRIADLNGSTKKRANFNIQESLISDYVVNFLNSVYSSQFIDEGDIVSSGEDIIFNTQVNADKGQVTYEAINGKFIRNLVSLSEAKRMNVLKAAFGNLYSGIYTSITNDYSKMDKSLIRIANPDSKALYDLYLSVEESIMMDKFLDVYRSNPNIADSPVFNELVHSNFRTFNYLSDLAGVNAYDMAMLLNKVHNVLNPMDRIDFIDQTHFLKRGVDGGKTHIQFNPLLVSKIMRFNPGMSANFDISKFASDPRFFNNWEQFYMAKNNELFFSMINNGIDISITNSTGRDNGFTGLKALKESNPKWFNGNRMILGKLHRDGFPDIPITSENDIRAFLEQAYHDAHIGGANNALSSNTALIEALGKMNYTIETNPDLVKFNWIDYFIGQSYEISSVGDNFNHPVNLKKSPAANDMELDAFSTYAQIKRNVSQTTTIRPWIVDHLNGIPRVINVAPIEDISNTVSSFSGAYKNISPHDGVSFMSPTAVYLFNNGLMNSRVGFDMKPFFHDYNVSTSTGVIIKTSSDALTNQTIKQGKNMKRMAYKMMGARWVDAMGNPISGNIFTDYGFRMFDNRGNKVNLFEYISNKYHPMVELSRGNVYEIVDIQYEGQDESGTPRYKREFKRVDKNGDYMIDEESIFDEQSIPIASNYDLWNALGGENSKMKSLETGKVIDSENSIMAVVDIMNNNGITHNNELIDSAGSKQITSQENVFQFMKFGNADLVASHGAMKQGYTNVNRYQDYYFNKKGLLNTMRFDLTHSGVVLDPTHKADNSMISELTQVVNALSSRGFTKEKSSQIYNALASITVSSVMDIVERTGGTMNYPNYNDLAANFIVMAMNESKAFDDKLREDCADLIDIVSNGGTIAYSDLKKRIDIGSNSFILGAIPIIASYINRISIVKKSAGTNALMKASSGIVQMHGNKLWGEIGVNDVERFKYLTALESSQRPLEHPSQTDMGHIYKMQMTADEFNMFYDNPNYDRANGNVFYDGNFAYFNLKDISVYKALKDMYTGLGGRDITESFIRPAMSNEEADINVDGNGYIALGRELAPINYHFTAGGVVYNMYDLVSSDIMYRARMGESVDDEVNDILMTNYGFKEPLPASMSTFDKAMVLYQKELNNLSDAYNGKGGWISVIDENGNVGRADIMGDISIKYYEAVAPNINQTKLGITDDVNISDINKGFFAKKLVSNFGLKVDPEHYTYSLLKQNGKHIYIYDTNKDVGKPFEPDSSMTKIDIKTEIDKSGHIYRIDNNGQRMYEISPNDSVYRKKNGVEIIVTSRPSIPISSFGFYGVKISPNVYKNADVANTPQNRAYVDHIITTIFKSASAVFDKEGNIIEGSESALYWTKETEDGTDYLAEKLEIAFNDYQSIENGVEIDSNSSYLQEQYVRAIIDGRIEEFKNGTVFQRSVYRDATALYNSFKESLNAIVARTPSQTMQSFMPMTIVAFDKSGNNSTYVSDMQVWLQGSDFDGDKTNFQEYALDNGGRFIGWSKLFDLAKLKESMRLPFPTSVEITEMKRINDEIQGEYDSLFTRLFRFNDKSKKFDFVSNDMRSLVRFLDIINSDSKAFNKGILRLPTKVKATQMESVKQLVNDHNMYMVDMNERKMNATKNFIAYKSISITEDPANLYESQSSVDDMDDISELGKEDKKSANRLKISSGNVVLKYDALVNNIVGKNVISVVASGMKTFFNIANYYNTMTDGEKNRFLIGKNGDGVSILGKTYNFVANWNPTPAIRRKLEEIVAQNKGGEPNTMNNSELIKNLTNLLNGSQSEKNAGLILLALLSEATDNAKNLNLAKINANENMASLYIYGITIGMDISDIGRIMMSNTARLYSKLSNGNIFYGESGPTSIRKFKEDYIDTYIDKKINSLGLERLSDLASNTLKRSDVFMGMLNESFTSKRTAYGYEPISVNYNKLYKVREFAIENINMTAATFYEKEKAVSGVNNYIDKVKSVLYIRRDVWRDKVDVGSKSYYIIDMLEELEKGRNEMFLVARIVDLNKGVETTRDKQLSFINAIRGMFNGDTSKKGREAADAFLRQYSDNPYSDRSGFDFARFINNPTYRAKAIQLYESYFKHTINVLDLAYSLPLIRSYVSVSNILNGITTSISVKYKVIDWVSEKAMQDLGNLNANERMSVIKHTSMYVNSSLFNRFLKQSKVNVFHIPADSKFYNDNMTLVETRHTVTDKLGTRRGNANYLKWMNETVIPNMKNGIYDETGNAARRIVNNKFINGLGMVTVDRTLSGTPIDVYAPTVDKRSNSEYAVIMSTILTNSAKKLDSAIYVDSNGMNHNVSDLLYIYNQLNFNGTKTLYSMDEFLSNNVAVKNAYSEFENILTEENAMQLIPYDYMSTSSPGVLQYLAPKGNINTSNSKILRGYNSVEMKNQFYYNIDGRYRIISDESNEYDNYVFAGSSSLDLIKTAMNYNRALSNERLDSKSFNLLDENVNAGDTRFADFVGLMKASRAGDISNFNLNAVRDMLVTVSNSTTGVVKMMTVDNKEFFVMKPNNMTIAFVAKSDKDLFYINTNNTVYYISPERYSEFGFEDYVGNSNFDGVKNLIDSIENQKMCSI